jgi:hypothetical protein
MKRTFFKRILQTWVMMVVISLPLIAFGASPVTTTVDRAKHPIRILAIGNSFSQDAIEQNLYELAAAEHIPLIIGNMYIGGCTLARHLHNADKNLPAYAYRKIVGGVKTEKKDVRLEEALKDEDWDYISLQQASGVSGLYDTYAASSATARRLCEGSCHQQAREADAAPDMGLCEDVDSSRIPELPMQSADDVQGHRRGVQQSCQVGEHQDSHSFGYCYTVRTGIVARRHVQQRRIPSEPDLRSLHRSLHLV